jgi:autotransporter-associated beta strand protein
LKADVALTVATPGTVVNTGSGSSYINVPVNVNLTNAGTMESLTLTFSYNSSLLSISTSNVTVGNIGSIDSSWAPIAYIPSAGTLIVTEAATSYVQANLATSVLNLDFQVHQGDSGFIPITFATPISSEQQVYDAYYDNLVLTQSLTTTFVNGGINASNVPSGTAIWTSTASGTWSTASNWINGPPVSGQKAVFSGSLASALTVTLDGSETAGGLTFSNSAGSTTGYRLVPAGSGTGTLTLNNSGSTIPLQVLSGSDCISAPITLAGNLAISESAGTTLSISGNISQSTTASLTLGGDGRLILSGSDSYTGGTTVSGGTLYLASQTALPPDRSLTVGAGGLLIFGTGLGGGPASMDLADSPAMGGASQPSGPSAEPVPEPGTLALALAGLVAGLALRRRRRAYSLELGA